jgi:hypothetical protein
MKLQRPKTVDEYIDLVHQAVYEIDELRTCMEYEPEQAEAYGPFIEQLDHQVRGIYQQITNGEYDWGYGEDFSYMPLVVRFGRFIPFQQLLFTINETHKNGLDVGF